MDTLSTIVIPPTLYLIDGSSFLYRAFYALGPLHTSKGVPVHAVYGFCRMLKKLMDDVRPEYMALVWDSKGPTVRHERYSAYKATRMAPPSDLFVQKEYIEQIAHQLGLVQVAVPGFEADDVLASLTQQYQAQGFHVVLVTTDKDMGQLVSDTVRLYDTFTQKYSGPAEMQAKYGFTPDRLGLYLAIMGDSSDNIPGVAGIGAKGATGLVQKYTSLDELYAQLDNITPPRLAQLLLAGKEAAYLSYDLVQLRYPPTDVTREQLVFDPAAWVRLRDIFSTLEFTSLLKAIDKAHQGHTHAVGAPGPVLALEHTIVRTRQDLEHLATQIRALGHVAIDTETTGSTTTGLTLVGISCAVKEGHAWYIPVAHEETAWDSQYTNVSHDLVREYLQPLLSDRAIKKYLHNAKYDMHALKAGGLDLAYVHMDTLVAAHLVRTEGAKIGLKSLSVSLLGEQMQSYADVVQGPYKNFAQVPIAYGASYAAADAHQTLKLVEILRAELERTHQMELFQSLEMPIMHILFSMEQYGIGCDVSVLAQLDKDISAQIKQVLATFNDMLPDEFKSININSPAQLKQLLFDHLGLPSLKKTGKGQHSTDQEVLQELAKNHPIPALIITYRELTKLHSTYVQGLLAARRPDTGTVHTSFNQTQTATGRLSSSDPNMQNIPTPGAGLSIRDAFIARPGCVFIAADYSQIELRVVAYLSQDQALMSTLSAGTDIHAHTASKLFDVEPHAVTSQQRQVGKRINFSILYGLTPYGLSKDLNISLGEAKVYIQKYYQAYPGLLTWMEGVVAYAQEHGYVQTWAGRRRTIVGIHERNKNLFEAARRMAINSVAQGTAADIMKLGMIKLARAIEQGPLQARILLQIHDELVLEVPQELATKVQALVHESLESVIDWNVPLVVQSSMGRSWGDVSR